MHESIGRFLLRFAPMIYGPTVLFALGQGAMIPILPVLAARHGADLATSGLVASALVIGQLCGNVPASWCVSRFGERVTMAIAASLALVGVAGLALAPSVQVLAGSVFLIGACGATFMLARLAFMTTRVPLAFRARALSLVGGAFRFGIFLGPFVGALLLWATSSENSAAWCFAACLIACLLLVLLGPDPEVAIEAQKARGGSRSADPHLDTGEPVTAPVSLPQRPRVGVMRTVIEYRGVLARLGLAAASLSALRASRQVVLPLWGLSLGLDAQEISLVMGVTGAIDFTLFYASGQIMDRFGRLWAVLPSMLLMGFGFLALAWTHDAQNAPLWFALLAGVTGVGNGLSSGILMTLAADAAPQGDPAPFLGAWRLLTDSGGAAAPVLFSGLAAAASLSVATGMIGVIGLLGALGFLLWLPRYAPGGSPKQG